MTKRTAAELSRTTRSRAIQNETEHGSDETGDLSPPSYTRERVHARGYSALPRATDRTARHRGVRVCPDTAPSWAR